MVGIDSQFSCLLACLSCCLCLCLSEHLLVGGPTTDASFVHCVVNRNVLVDCALLSLRDRASRHCSI